MKKLISYLCISGCIILNANAQSTFNKAFGYFDGSYGQVMLMHDFIQVADGGFLIVGAYGSGEGDPTVVKTDANGVIQWQKKYTTSDMSEEIYKVAQSNDGGFMLVGNYSDQNISGDPMRGLILKINQNGDLVWSKTVTKGTDNIWLRSITKISNGTFTIAGIYAPTTGVDGALLYNINDNGVIQWTKSYSSGGSDEGAISMETTSDGGFVMAGGSGTFFNQNIMLTKVSSNGTLQWAKTYDPGTSADIGRVVIQASDGGYLVGGLYTDPQGGLYSGRGFLAKTDANGNLTWAKTYNYNNTGGEIKKIRQTSDGGYIVVSEYALLKLNASGTPQWSKQFNGSGVWNVRQISTEYVIIGSANWGPGGNYFNYYDALFAKTDANGVNCNSTNVSIPSSNLTPTVNSPAVTTQTPTITLSTYTLTQQNSTFTTVSKCPCPINAGPDKSNLNRPCCPTCTAVSIGTPSSGYYYNWEPCNGTLSSCTTAQPNAYPCSTTNYTLTVSGNGCITVRDEVKITTNLEVNCNPITCPPNVNESVVNVSNPDLNDENPISSIQSLVPNPTANQVRIYYSLEKKNAEAQISIMNIYGQEVIKYPLDFQEEKLDMNCTGLANGIYFCKLLVNDHPVSIKRLIITR